MKKLSLKQKIGQLMVIGFNGLSVPANFSELIKEYQIGGVILFGRNIGTPEEILELTTSLQKMAKKAGNEQPLLICLDQENGMVRRLGEGTTLFPGSMLVGATKDKQSAYDISNATGKELKALGINWNLAPVLDINNNPDNPVIGVRSFGETPEQVSEFGIESMKGMQEAGIMTTLKHFPGHGDTNVDSHLDLPVINHSMERLYDVELKPFLNAINEGADAIMSAHVYFPALEKEKNKPATLSKNVLTGLLREELNFKGIITTDCLEMKAISETIGTEKGAVEAFKAGVDLLMVSHTYDVQVGAMKALEEAYKNSEITEERLDESVQRIIEMKEKYLSWDQVESLNKENLPREVGTAASKELATTVYRKGVTVVKDDDAILPIKDDASVLILFPDSGKTLLVEDKRFTDLNISALLKSIAPTADILVTNEIKSESEVKGVLDKAKNVDYIIVGTLNATKSDKQVSLINKIKEVNTNTIGIGLRSPYDLNYYPSIPTYLNTYEFTQPAIEIAIKAIYGKEEVSGSLPVSLN